MDEPVRGAKPAILFDLFHTLTALETTWGAGRPRYDAAKPSMYSSDWCRK
jgi:hypothetical protein